MLNMPVGHNYRCNCIDGTINLISLLRALNRNKVIT